MELSELQQQQKKENIVRWKVRVRIVQNTQLDEFSGDDWNNLERGFRVVRSVLCVNDRRSDRQLIFDTRKKTRNTQKS